MQATIWNASNSRDASSNKDDSSTPCLYSKFSLKITETAVSPWFIPACRVKLDTYEFKQSESLERQKRVKLEVFSICVIVYTQKFKYLSQCEKKFEIQKIMGRCPVHLYRLVWWKNKRQKISTLLSFQVKLLHCQRHPILLHSFLHFYVVVSY